MLQKKFSNMQYFIKFINIQILQKKYILITFIPIILLIAISIISENAINNKRNAVMLLFNNLKYELSDFSFAIIIYVITVIIHYIAAWGYITILSRELKLLYSIIVLNLTDELMYIDNSEFHDHETTELSTIINRQAYAACTMLEVCIIVFLPLIFSFIGTFYSLLQKFPVIVFIVFLLLLILLFVYIAFTTLLINAKKKKVNYNEIVVKNKIFEILKNFNIIKVYFQEKKELQDFKNSLDTYSDASIDYNFTINNTSLGFRMILLVFNITSLIYLYLNKDKFGFNFEICTLFFENYRIFKNKVSKVKDALGKVSNSYIDIVNVDINKETTYNEKFVTKTDFSKIEFQNLQFAYKKKLIFEKFNFSFKPGDKIAITGRNGQGKSTIINSILGFCNYKGNIVIDDNIIIKDNTASLRPIISYVPQDSCIKNDSVYANLIYGLQEDIGLNDLEKMCIKFDYHHVFKDLKEGYATNAGDGGKFLSGGQRQIINFMRAILRNKPILILDEPTSNLDYNSSCILLDNIFNNLKDKTVFYCTHDLACLKKFDKIININNGIIEIYDDANEFMDLAFKKRLL